MHDCHYQWRLSEPLKTDISAEPHDTDTLLRVVETHENLEHCLTLLNKVHLLGRAFALCTDNLQVHTLAGKAMLMIVQQAHLAAWSRRQ